MKGLEFLHKYLKLSFCIESRREYKMYCFLYCPNLCKSTAFLGSVQENNPESFQQSDRGINYITNRIIIQFTEV